jgi:hypothetical protein
MDSMGLAHVYHHHLRQIIPQAGIIRICRDSTPHFYLFDAHELKVMNLGYVLRDFPFLKWRLHGVHGNVLDLHTVSISGVPNSEWRNK